MNKLTKILIAVILIFIGITILLFLRVRFLQKETERHQANYNTVAVTLDIYKKNGQWFSHGGTLDLKMGEIEDSLKAYFRKEFDLKLRSIKTIIQNTVLVTTTLETKVKDTLIFDTIPAKVFHGGTEYTEIDYLENTLTDDIFLTVSTQVPLIQVIHKRKIGFKPFKAEWWDWPRPLDQTITSPNSEAKITYSRVIFIN